MKLRKSLVGISVASALLAMSGNAAASAFALIEQSSGLGNAFAGGAAAAEDATTIFFNPAGMSRLKGKQVSVAGSFIKPSAKFSDTLPGRRKFQLLEVKALAITAAMRVVWHWFPILIW